MRHVRQLGRTLEQSWCTPRWDSLFRFSNTGPQRARGSFLSPEIKSERSNQPRTSLLRVRLTSTLNLYFILNTVVSVWLWLIRIKTRPKHYQDVLFSQNKPQNLNLTQKFGLEKSLSGFFPSWSLHIYHIYIYISKK